jgi:hypothetical protein
MIKTRLSVQGFGDTRQQAQNCLTRPPLSVESRLSAGPPGAEQRRYETEDAADCSTGKCGEELRVDVMETSSGCLQT